MYHIRHLAKKHEVHLYCLADCQDDLRYTRDLNEFCHTVEAVYLNPSYAKMKSLFALLSTQPLTLPYFYSSQLKRRVDEAVAKTDFDVAVAYSSGTIPYIADLDMPRVIDFVDLDSQKWLQFAKNLQPPMKWIYSLEGRRLFRYEKESSEWADASILVTPEEGEVLEAHGDPFNLQAVSLGVDIDYYEQDVQALPEIAAMNRPVLIFVGNMDYRPNYESVLRFARSILPRVSQVHGDVLFLVVGANPPPQVKALHDGVRIIVTGKVADTRPYLKAADISVVPLSLGRGIQTKVLESMAIRLPVVLSPSAALGINAESGRDYHVADSDAELAARIVELLEDPEKAREMARAGHVFVKENFAWQEKLLQYEKIIEDAVTRFRSRRNVQASVDVSSEKRSLTKQGSDLER